jgi:hypothetical protein
VSEKCGISDTTRKACDLTRPIRNPTISAEMIAHSIQPCRILKKLALGGKTHFGATVKMLGVVLLCGCLAGCGSSATNLTGNWQFTFKSSASGNTYTGTALITQGGYVNSLGSGIEGAVTGTVNLAHDPCATTAPLSGTISGLSVIITLTQATQPVSLTGSVNAAFTAMSGTYAAALGGCTAGDFGSWTARKS